MYAATFGWVCIRGRTVIHLVIPFSAAYVSRLRGLSRDGCPAVSHPRHSPQAGSNGRQWLFFSPHCWEFCRYAANEVWRAPDHWGVPSRWRCGGPRPEGRRSRTSSAAWRPPRAPRAPTCPSRSGGGSSCRRCVRLFFSSPK
jgi:hypothetical protein